MKPTSRFSILKSMVALVLLVMGSLMSFDAYSNESSGGFRDGMTVDQEISGIIQYPIQVKGEELEYAHLWFKQILGGFIFAPWEQMGIDNGAYDKDDVTVLSKALGFTNVLSMILCLIIVYYMIVGGAINTAAEGETLGKSWNTPWLMMRTSVGFALITPLKAVGGMTMSFSQVVVIWLLMTGSNAASLLWTYVISEITEGTVIVQPSIELGSAKTAELMKMLICTDANVRGNTDDDYQTQGGPGGGNTRGPGGGQSGSNRANTTSSVDEDSRTLYTIYRDSASTNGTRTLSNSGSAGNDYMWGSESFDMDASTIPAKITFGPNGECGEISFPVVNADANSDNDSAADANRGVSALDYKGMAIQEGGKAFAVKLSEVINALLPGVRALSSQDEDLQYNNIRELLASENVDKSSDLYQDYLVGYEAFKKAARIYATEIVPAVHSKASGNEAVVNKMYDEMSYGGWPVAGIWFYDLSALPGLTFNAIQGIHQSIAAEAPNFCWIVELWGNCSEMEGGAEVGYELTGYYLKRLTEDESVNFATALDDAQALCSEDGGCAGGTTATDRVSVTLARSLLGTLGNSEDNVNPMDNPGNLSSPFLFAAEIGHTLNYAAQYAIGVGVGLHALVNTLEWEANKPVSAGEGFLDMFNPFSDVWHFLGVFLKNIVISSVTMSLVVLGMIAAACLSSGFLLAYVIPFLPVTTWIMMMAGYMLTVVEAVAAAPLAVVLLFTPEGQGISGSRFERALQLVAMAILRPSFMVLGMLAGLTVSFVAFGMMNIFFFRAAEHVLSGTAFDVVAIVVLYVGATYQLCKLMVESMHQLPDRLSEWFAGGVSRPFGESRISDNVEGTLQGLGGKINDIPKQVLSAQKSMLSDDKRE